MMSSPDPPSMRSSPPRPKRSSSPARPLITSSLGVPNNESSPAVPVTVAAAATVAPASAALAAIKSETSHLLGIKSLPAGDQSPLTLTLPCCHPSAPCSRADTEHRSLRPGAGADPAGDRLGSGLAQEVDLGPGDRRRSLTVPDLRRPRRRPLADGARLEHGGAAPPRAPARSGRSRVRMARGARCGDRGRVTTRHRGRAARDGHAAVGQRRQGGPLGAARPARLRELPGCGLAPLPSRAPLDDLGRADQGVELPAAAPRPRTPAHRPRPQRPAHLRPHARSRLRRAEGSQPGQPRDRRQLVHGRHRPPAPLARGAAAAERPTAADGPLRPQPVHAAPAARLPGADRARLRGLRRPRHARALARPQSEAARPEAVPSETSFPTDHANFEFNFWLTRDTQAGWVSDALRESRRWSRIYTFGYLGLYDDAVRPDGLQVERGLVDRAGRPKPAYEAFKRG